MEHHHSLPATYHTHTIDVMGETTGTGKDPGVKKIGGEDLQSRLRRLGVVKGTRRLKPPSRDVEKMAPSDQIEPVNAGEAHPIERLLPGGRVVETPYGACFVVDHIYPVNYQHGDVRLADLAVDPIGTVAPYSRDDRLENLGHGDFLFLDTETTGLAGAGTLAFLVGVAYFTIDRGHEAFVVRQMFLRDHGDEAAMLYLLAELLAEKQSLVTFNGRSFDIPLLNNRYWMNRLDNLVDDLPDIPHLDLLPLSRRLWRRRVGSCSLNSLETNLLGMRRSQEDVPGWLIPGLYMDYLRTGDARELLRVFYHNRIDMLSMVTLAVNIVRQLHRPQAGDQPLDLISLAHWQNSLGKGRRAEDTLRLVVDQDLPLDLYQEALSRLAMLLKREGRRDEAVVLWQQVAVTTFNDVTAHVELAKHFEWQEQDLEQAQYWTTQALSLVDGRQEYSLQLQQVELKHRLARLERKMAGDSELDRS